MFKKKFLAIAGALAFALLGVASPAQAAPLALSPHSWDPGLIATVSSHFDTVTVTGARQTTGAWGTGPVNYQAGATINTPAASKGDLSVRMEAKDCAARFQCEYGSGTGYKGLVQFWNDPENYIAFGLIHDPGVSPTGFTVMVEGAAHGKPVGGYWPGNAVGGPSHAFEFSWDGSSITWDIDHKQKLGPYWLNMSHPSISFLGAARENGDKVNVAFENINFSGEGVKPVAPPTAAPYAEISATLQAGGSGTGYNSMLNIHDAHNNAVAFGLQADTAAPESQGTPSFMMNRVQGGNFTYSYFKKSDNNPHEVTIQWWKDGTTVFIADGQIVGRVTVNMTPRLFFQAEGDARKNGDTLNSTAKNVRVKVGDNAAESGLNGSWNTNGPGFANFGLQGHNTNGVSQNGADFRFTGTVNGLPPNGDWDSHPVYAVAMIAQYWHGL
ncbi:hypothetical protein [uncultured Mobiluncus sp.]|uniref:hypothetical protein n=1 Tax=uncultured Mobiluncus sp. TaxID=293425 RepID=UPI0025E2BE06|nr:hypothetical protein [uncultured Mobiluncus sp.]